MDYKMHAIVKYQLLSNQTDWESNGALEYLIVTTALRRKDWNSRGEDMTWDLPERQPFVPPIFLTWTQWATSNEQGHGYNLMSNKIMSKETGKVAHLLYMDDLKLFAPNDEKSVEQLKLVKRYSDDIQMEFGWDKCVKYSFVWGKPTKTDNIKTRHKYNTGARERSIIQIPRSRRGPPNMSQTNSQNNWQRIPA